MKVPLSMEKKKENFRFTYLIMELDMKDPMPTDIERDMEQFTTTKDQ